MRGAFINSGSKDAGRDPDWVEGVYRGYRGEVLPEEEKEEEKQE